LPETASPVQFISHDELMSTGALDLAASLRQLVPVLR
jgi:hypothetical protein